MKNNQEIKAESKEVLTKIDETNAKLVHHQISMYSGPLPTPEQLEKYEAISPGAAEKIIKMTIKQAEHRQELEKMDAKSAIRDSIAGLTYAFIICLSSVGGTVFLMNGDHTIGGSILCGSSLVAIISAFIQGKNKLK